MRYDDLVIEAAEATTEATADKRRLLRFKVRVLDSPRGSMAPEEAIAVEIDDKALQASIQRLDARGLDQQGMIGLGRTLALLLLPPGPANAQTGVRELFDRNMATIGPEQGLRLRLRLPPRLAALPWEYLYVDRAGGGDGMDGFLALDPRLSIVRHQALATTVVQPLVPGSLTVVAALASAAGFPVLDLERERNALEQAFAGQSGITPIILPDATLDEVQQAIPNAHVFHFAGHGVFTQEMSDEPGVYTGKGALAFEDQRVDAEQLGINLRGSVRLALLGGCQTGQQDGVNVWSGVAPALVKAEIPVVVANQFSITDSGAIAFSKACYEALVGGLSVERAVSAGRIAAYNAEPAGRDWGAAVLYLRAADSILFAPVEEQGAGAAAAAQATAAANVRVAQVDAGAYVTGFNVGTMGRGSLVATISAGDVAGDVAGVRIKTLTGGDVTANVEVEHARSGAVISGGTIDNL